MGKFGLITIIFLLIHNGTPFNIDWKYPIIIQTRGGISNRVANYFGAKVNLFATDEGAAWILIGAPKANSTLASQTDVFEPGVIWQCSIGREPADTCRVLVMDSTGNQETGRYHKLKDGQWFGGPGGIALGSSNVVGCGPLLEKRDVNSSESFIHGACYTRPRSDLFQAQLPSPSKIPLEPFDITEDVSKKFGLAGFSVHMPKTGNEIVMGAPGFLKWRGALIQYLSSDGGSTFSKSFVSDPSKYQDKISPFSYLGYSLTSGQILHESSLQYVAGAPRANRLKGKVVVFNFPEKKEESLKIVQEILGEQIGSYFGSSVMALDVNGDGWDDLLVGAPRFSRGMITIQPLMGSRLTASFANSSIESKYNPGDFEKFKGYGDEGAVYVFLSNNGNLGRMRDQILVGSNAPASQFGTAMVSLGDINRDGVNDFAISAPFEDSSGAVYIYHGSKSGRLAFSQIIRAKDIASDLKGFGMSLSGNVDVDRNGIPDIAIGSFNSSQVVVLRSKRVINVVGRLESVQKNLPLDTEAFTLKSCVAFTGDYAPDSVKLVVNLQSDAKSRKSRVSLKFSDWNQPGANQAGAELLQQTSIKYEVLAYKGQEICTSFVAIVTAPLETSGAPVVFQQNISIPDPSPPQVSKRVLTIEPDGGSFTNGESFSSFCKTCPMTSTGQPSQTELGLSLAIPCGDDDICHADLKLDFNYDKTFVIGSSPTLSIEIILSNEGEMAIAPALIITWQRTKLVKIPGDCLPQPELHNMITYKCQMGQLLDNDTKVSLNLEFDMSTLIVSELQPISELLFNFTAITASELPGKVSEMLNILLTASADLHIGGSRYIQPFNMEMVHQYLVFKHEFEIGMDGVSPVGDFEILFKLPVNLTTYTDGYVVSVRGVNHDDRFQCQPTKGQFHNFITTGVEPEDDDPKFEAGGIAIPIPRDEDVSRESNSSFVEKGFLLMHCDSPFVACMEVTCKVKEYQPGKASVVVFIIDIEANVIRSLMKAHKVNGIKVESKGILVLPEAIKNIQPTVGKPDESIAITIIEKEGYKPVSKWIYTLAVVIGLIILACVVFCLYSCGCFETKKKRFADGEDTVDADATELEPLNEANEAHEDKEVDKEQIEKDQPEEEDLKSNGHARGNSTTTPVSLLEPPDFIPPEPQSEHPISERENVQENQQIPTDNSDSNARNVVK